MSAIYGAKIGDIRISVMRDIFYGWMVRIGDDVDFHPVYSMTQQQVEGLIKLKWPETIPKDFTERLYQALVNLKSQQPVPDAPITYPVLEELDSSEDLNAQVKLFSEILQKFLSPGRLDVIHLKHCKVHNEAGAWRVRYTENQHFTDVRFEDPVAMVRFITKKWKS